MRARASEFPNDNPALHRGAVWVMNEPCGEWEAERSATLETPPPSVTAATTMLTSSEPASTLLPPAPDTERGCEARDEPGDEPEDDIEVVEELEPIDFDPVSDDGDPFAAFVRMLVEVAVEAGCDKTAAILPALLDEGRVAPGGLPENVIEALLANGTLARTESGLVGGEALRGNAAAWRAILRGDSEDFSSCGPRMLDEWAAHLVASLALAPAKTEGLRRKLRTRGVAAFGLVAA
jgi:hypothetical protein